MTELLDYYLSNKGRIVGSLARSLGCSFSAEDVFHNAVENCVRYYHLVDKVEDFHRWFSTIVRMEVYKHFEEKRNIFEEFDEFDFEHDNSEVYINKLSKDALRVASYYKPRDREVLENYLRNDYTPKEVSLVTGVPLRTVYNILNKFKQEMRERYGR